ncbi:MAG: hypothetical protein ABJC26_15870 [Gemmatimonadaceae bacterium]
MSEKKTDSKPGKDLDESRKPAQHEDHNKSIDGPMSKNTVHKTESTEPHPQGKTRHGGRNG